MFIVMFYVNVTVSRLCQGSNFVNVNGVQLYMELGRVNERTLYFRMLWDSGVGGCYI